MRRSLITTAVLGMAAFSANAQNLLSNGSFETPGPGFIVFEDWQHFNNVFADESVEQTPQDGMTSGKMFGFGNGMQKRILAWFVLVQRAISKAVKTLWQLSIITMVLATVRQHLTKNYPY